MREFGQEHARYLRAEALMQLRRYDDALRWYQTSFQGSPAELVYLAPGHLREGQIFEARGEREKAATHDRRELFSIAVDGGIYRLSGTTLSFAGRDESATMIAGRLLAR